MREAGVRFRAAAVQAAPAFLDLAGTVAKTVRLIGEAAARAEGIAAVRDGTYVCIEGPQFSTLAESLTYKQLGYSVIPSSTKRENLASNLRSQALQLTADDMAPIAALERNGREVSPEGLAPAWD